MALTMAAAFTFIGAAQRLADPRASRSVAWALVMFLLPLAWWILIARVIHAEALPGDRQFWTTRPYAWKSLLGAKALFVLLFVNLPLLIADAVILRAYGFSPGAEIPGLLWTQVLLTAAFVLPTAALSAITTGLIQLLLTVVVLAAAIQILSIAAPDASLGTGWITLDWVTFYYALLVITVAALGILLWQYARRRTLATRSLAAAAVILAALGTELIPWTTAFAIQSRLFKKQVDQSSLHIGFDSSKKWAARALIERDGQVRIEIPLQITGVPAGMDAKPDGLVMTMEGREGVAWRADQRPWNTFPLQGKFRRCTPPWTARFTGR